MAFGIRARLLAAFVAVALCTAALGWYAVGSMQRLNEDQRTLYDDVFGGTHLLATWIDVSWEARSDVLTYLLADNQSDRDHLRNQIRTLDGALDGLVSEMDVADTDRQDVQTLTGLVAAWQAYKDWRDVAVIAPVEAGHRASAAAAYRTEGLRRVDAVDSAIDAFLQQKGAVGESLNTSGVHTYEMTRNIAVGLAAFATGLALLTGFFLSRSIASTARQVAAAATALALGDLDQHIAVRSTDELGQMAAAFREMIGYQQEMAAVADAIANGDLTREVRPKSNRDVLGSAVQRMGANLRALIGELKQAAHDNTLLNAELELRVAERTAQAESAVRDLRDQIAERERAEGALRESEERLRLAVDIAGVGTWDWNLRHDRIVWSESMERMAGLEPGTFGETLAAFKAFVHPDDLDLVESSIASALEHGGDYRAEFRMTCAGGVVKWMDTYGKVYYDEQRQPVRLVGVTRDVSERRQADQQREVFHRSEKLRALGQMASGIAHDLNQSLMLVASYSDMAREALDREPVDRDELREMFTTASQAALDGGETVKRLLQFARAPMNEERQSVDLERVARAAVTLTAPRWRDAAQSAGRPISVHVEATKGALVLGSPSHLREAITNLLFNADDALPAGGTIRVRVSVTDTRAIIEVTDSGVGMPPEIQARIFEPFFTTKGEHGTGLGLAQVFGIVEQHAGQIEVESAPGTGTTIRLSFPAAAEGSPPAHRQRRAPSGPQVGLRILIVDDEPAMVKAVARMLRPSGHTVRTAGSGEEALDHLASEPFDVVVSDLGMGAGMTGWDLADVVRRKWPQVRFVLATGWGAGIDQAEAATRGVKAVLAKPYRLGDLQYALVATDQLAA